MGPRRPAKSKIVVSLALLGMLSVGSASATPAPDPAAVLDGSLIWNGSFDVGDSAGHPHGWTVEGNEGGAKIVNRSAFRTSGLTSLQLKDDATSAIKVRSKRVVGTPGDEYAVTLDLKGEGASGTAPTITIEFWGMPVMPEQQGPLLDTAVLAPAYSTGWQNLEFSGTAPEGTVQVSVVIDAAIAAAGTTHVDNVRMTGAPAAYDPAVGPDHELLVDSYRIEAMDDVGRVVHPAVKDEAPLIVADKPWEKTVYYGSVVRPTGSDTYQLFYTCYNDVPPNYHLCLAESTDFLHWSKPTVGVYEWNGSKDNNIVTAPGGSVTYNPDAPADSRYRMMYFGTPFGYHGSSSPDGIHWTPVSDQPLLPGGDVISVKYDEVTKQYIATYKDRLFQSDTPGTYDRSAFISTSKDFLNWSPRVLAVNGDVADDGVAYALGGVEGQIYGMPVFRYGNQFLALPWNFSITDFTSGIYRTAGDGTVTPSLATSRDLLHWDRAARGALIEPGNPGAWNDGALYTSNYFKVTDETVELLYGGFNTGHGGALEGKTQKASIGRAVWRRDGFVSIGNAAMSGHGDPGSVTTKPLEFTGEDLHVNAQTLPGGTLTVEVLDAETGRPVPGLTAADAVPVTGDRLDANVRWKGGKTLAAVAGEQIRLTFYLTGADLYSYWFTA